MVPCQDRVHQAGRELVAAGKPLDDIDIIVGGPKIAEPRMSATRSVTMRAIVRTSKLQVGPGHLFPARSGARGRPRLGLSG